MQFETYTHEFFKDIKLHTSFGRVHVFFQIALETILLPMQIAAIVSSIYNGQTHWSDQNLYARSCNSVLMNNVSVVSQP